MTHRALISTTTTASSLICRLNGLRLFCSLIDRTYSLTTRARPTSGRSARRVPPAWLRKSSPRHWAPPLENNSGDWPSRTRFHSLLWVGWTPYAVASSRKGRSPRIAALATLDLDSEVNCRRVFRIMYLVWKTKVKLSTLSRKWGTDERAGRCSVS